MPCNVVLVTQARTGGGRELGELPAAAYDVVPMSPRETRVVRNEALFREVNIRIADLEEHLLGLDEGGMLSLVCECGHTGCTNPIKVDPASFERVRENSLRFFVTPGHEDPAEESVVGQRPGYLIVEKRHT